MACGVPVIASDNSAMMENLQGAAELVPASSVEALENAMLELATNDARRAELVRLGFERVSRFRWERTARLVLDCYRELGRKLA
jgi:glycosyltransferase involved in cell wall biosynthesis